MLFHQSKTAVILFAATVFFSLFPSTFQQQFTSPQEKSALLQLRSSLGLRTKEWPIKSDPCISWVGIQCQNSRVTGVNISGFKRTRLGSLNPQFSIDSLANLTLLHSFNASNFFLPGSIPEWVGTRLVSIRVLDLRSCSISGVIPSTLGNLTNLLSLYLSDNNLTGLVPLSLAGLSGLLELDFSRNGLTGPVPSYLGVMRNLTYLDMSSNNLAGPIPPGIGTLSELRVLNLSRNGLSSLIPAQLGDLSRLLDLDLGFNFLSGPVPPDLIGLRNLERMVVGNNLLSGVLPGNLFARLIRLQFLSLSHNNFTGGLPDIMWSMAQLRFLDAAANNFSGTLPNVSLNAVRTTAVFNLSNNMFYGGLTSVIGMFGFIDLSGNYFQGKVPENTSNSGNVTLNRNCLQNVSSQRSVGECASFYAQRGMTFDNFGMTNEMQPPPPRSERRSRRNVIILAGVLGGFAFVAFVVVVMVVLIVCARKRGGTTTQRGTGVGPVPTAGSPSSPGVALNFSSLGDSFTYQQILLATSQFSDENLIKYGHSGTLFRGILEGGIPVVIKRIDLVPMKKETYISELDFFGKVSHPRLVPLLGHCLENENENENEKFLIYKYMPNRDLSSSLFKKTNLDDDPLQSLDWITRLKIATGAAEGLSYLHHECTPPLVHRDIQASSILLDDKFEVRLGSLSEVCAQEGDIHQSRITRLLRIPQTSEQGSSGTPTATCAYDVYCFGKVLLELITGKLGMSASSDATVKDWLEGILPYISINDKELVTNIVDPSLVIYEDLLEEVWAMAIVARSCLNPKPSRRPLMRYILKALENPLKVVREEHTSSARLRTTSSRGSWNAALFGSWRHSSSDVVSAPVGGAAPATKVERGGSFKLSGTSGSQGSGQNGDGARSSSTRRQSKEIFPEPQESTYVEPK